MPTVCMPIRLAGDWTYSLILYIFRIYGFIYRMSMPGEYEHSYCKNRGHSDPRQEMK
jgi:hypothetical protein